MLRMILLIVFLLIFAAAALLLLGVLRWVNGPAATRSETTVADNFRTMAYLVLVVLMFGVTSGILGAA